MSKSIQLLISLVIAAAILGVILIILNVLQNTDVPMATEDIGDSLENTNPADGELNTNPHVVLETSRGNIELELYEDQMPVTVRNFVTLVEENFYDGTRFHRAIPNFMVQGGDPLTKNTSLKERWGTGGPGYTIDDEFKDGLSNVRGTIAMANTGQPNSGGSQFFINVADNTFLDFDKEPLTSKHPVFGRVVRGMDVVDAIVAVPTEGPDRPVDDVLIERVYIAN